MKNFAVACDFSQPAMNGVDYAAQFASRLQLPITLLHVVQGVHPEVIEIKDVMGDVAYRENCLKTIAFEVSQEYHIDCTPHVELTLDTLEETLAALAQPHALLVMGTNGAENYFQHFFGSNTLNVMQQVKCPLMMVPETVRYRPIRKIVYAYQPDTNPIFFIDQLREFALEVNASVTVLHIA